MEKGAWMQFPQQQHLNKASDKRTGRYNILNDVSGNFWLHIMCHGDHILQWSPGWTQLIASTAVPKASINMKWRWITTIVMWDFQYHMTPREGWWWSKDKKEISWSILLAKHYDYKVCLPGLLRALVLILENPASQIHFQLFLSIWKYYAKLSLIL